MNDEGWQPIGEEQVHIFTFYQTPQLIVDRLKQRTWQLTDEELAGEVAMLEAAIAAHTDDPLKPMN